MQKGTTVVTVNKLPGIYTRVKNLQVYILSYVTGDARPDISLDTVNVNYMASAGLKEGNTYVCNWEEIGTRVNPETKEQLPRFTMRFAEVSATDPLERAIKLKQFEQVFGNHQQEEEARRSKFRNASNSNVTNVNRHVESTAPVTADEVDDDAF